ncbi:acireductone synthase [Leptospira biflexa]|jgi:enolase-phosphatase E1|uniref:acireductone synthase n=1 Tax=Leptospira biflexa TaxID=172 RepID=UPI0010830964|nr:acireductone synthase [Leptospira biflexa]TGM31878.1 acireductone synthase [Leptospira biflexa]TGM37020.1 acireductone synthase [Leptospira biflexa]
MQIKHNLLDIEGTTAPIAFVHQILFPYAKKNIHRFLKEYQLTELQWKEVQTEFQKDTSSGDPLFIEKFRIKNVPSGLIVNEVPNTLSKDMVSVYFEYLIEKDRKFGPLKEIQGKIWKEGYESGEIKSTVFDDVPKFLNDAIQSGIQNHVYSSGSVEAQHLIYQYSMLGDLRQYFTMYFDTAVGGKREKTSYERIASTLAVSPSEIRFFTDIVEEAEAANATGMDVVIFNRPGNLAQKPHPFPVWEHF